MNEIQYIIILIIAAVFSIIGLKSKKLTHKKIFLICFLFILFSTYVSSFSNTKKEDNTVKSILLIDDNYLKTTNYSNLIVNNLTKNIFSDYPVENSHMNYLLENANTYLVKEKSVCKIDVIEIAEDNSIDTEDINKLNSYDLNNYDIINISWGSNKNYIEYELFQKLLNEKKDLIINASNSNIKNENFYPANLENITSVSNLSNFMNKSKSDYVIKSAESSSLATFYKSLNDSGCIK